MSVTIALSAYPGDAAFGIGALLAALPGDKRHLTVFTGTEPPTDAQGALATLGARHVDLALPTVAGPEAIAEALAPHLRADEVTNVLLPLPLATRAGEGVLAKALHVLRGASPDQRYLAYYPLPYVAQHRAQFPELAFARPIRGLAEADADAGMLQWKPRGANAPAGPLATKLDACRHLGPELSRRLFPDPELPPPTDPAELTDAYRRGLGTREWIQLA